LFRGVCEGKNRPRLIDAPHLTTDAYFSTMGVLLKHALGESRKRYFWENHGGKEDVFGRPEWQTSSEAHKYFTSGTYADPTA
jgi:hypothetical protein